MLSALVAETGHSDQAQEPDPRAIIAWIMGVLDAAADYGKAVKAADQRTSAAHRGYGRDIGNSDEAFFGEVFGAGPTKETLAIFPPSHIPVSVDGRPSEELVVWSQMIAGHQAQAHGLTDDDQVQGYLGEVSPKLIELGSRYLLELQSAQDSVTINGIVSELASPDSDIDATIQEGVDSTHRAWAAGELEGDVIMPAVRTAMLRGNYDRVGELLPFVINADPETAADQRAEFIKGLLPEYQSSLSQAIPTIFADAIYDREPGTLNAMTTVYEMSGGSGTPAAVNATVDAVKAYVDEVRDGSFPDAAHSFNRKQPRKLAKLY